MTSLQVNNLKGCFHLNNAGIYEFAGIEDITKESFHQMFNINVLGSILTIKQAVKLFDDWAA